MRATGAGLRSCRLACLVCLVSQHSCISLITLMSFTHIYKDFDNILCIYTCIYIYIYIYIVNVYRKYTHTKKHTSHARRERTRLKEVCWCQGGTGDSVCGMGRFAWFNALARKHVRTAAARDFFMKNVRKCA